jgi:hypothetical protein
MNKSDTIGKLAAALSKAQSQMEPAKKDTKGNFGKFADLGEVIDTIRRVSTPNGLSFSQFPVGDAAGVGVSTILMHESGEWLSDTIYLPATEEMGKRNGAQAAGGNITYLRRYALASVFGVYADEDTDGNQTARHTPQAKPQAAPVQWTRDMAEWEPFAAVAKELGFNLEGVKEILQVTNIHDYKGTREQAEQEIRKVAALPPVKIGKGIPAMTK